MEYFIKTNAGEEIQVDREDIDFLHRHNWWLCNSGYARTSIGNKTINMHDLIFGTKSSGKVIDHINRNKLDNRKENLREVSVWHNAVNRGKMKGAERKYDSPYVGVFHKHNAVNTTYEGGLSVKGRYFAVGRFKTELDAALNRDAFAYFVHGDLAFLNFPDRVEDYKSWKFKNTVIERYQKYMSTV